MKILYFFLILLPLFSNSQEQNIDSLNQASIVSFCGYNNEEEIEKPIQLEWVQTDIDIVKDYLNKVNVNTIEQILKILPNLFDGKCNCSSKTYECGYNLKSTIYKIHGGYGSYNVSIIYFDNYILKIRTTFEVEKEIITNYLLPEIKFPLNCIYGRVGYEKSYSENLKKYNSIYGRLYLESKDSNIKRDVAINYFTDALEGSTFEKPFYILDGLGHETFNHLRYFIVVKDYDALENILYTSSPTSRQFAALTLRYLTQNSDYKPKSDVKVRMDEILANPKIIESGIISCRINKFEHDKYDVDKNFEEYLITQ